MTALFSVCVCVCVCVCVHVCLVSGDSGVCVCVLRLLRYMTQCHVSLLCVTELRLKGASISSWGGSPTSFLTRNTCMCYLYNVLV